MAESELAAVSAPVAHLEVNQVAMPSTRGIAQCRGLQRSPQTHSHSQLKWRRYFGCLAMRTPRMPAACAFVSAMTSAA